MQMIEKPKLTVYSIPETLQTGQAVGLLTTAEGNFSPVILDAGSPLPFSDKSVILDHPPKGAMVEDRERFTVVTENRFANPIAKIPVAGGIVDKANSARELKRDPGLSARDFIQNCLEHHLVTPERVGDLAEIFRESDPAVFFEDMAAGISIELLSWVYNAPVIAITSALTGNAFLTAAATFASQALVREAYWLKRYSRERILFRARDKDVTGREQAEFTKKQFIIALMNLIPVLGTVSTASISFAKNEELITIYRNIILDGLKSKFRRKDKVKTSSYGSKETFLGNFSKHIMDEISGSDFPILTASQIGLDPDTLAASRAHDSLAVAFGRRLSGDGGYPVADLGRILPEKDFRDMYGMVKSGRKLAGSRILSKARIAVEPVLRHVVDIERYFRDISPFFLGGLEVKGRPITTFHYAVGNAVSAELIRRGRFDLPVIHFITDPYVHETYFKYATEPFTYYFTFDEGTKAFLLKKGVKENKIFVAGYPVSPHLEDYDAASNSLDRYAYNPGDWLNVGVFTGGLGGNVGEILAVAGSLDYSHQKGIFYCGTNPEIADRLMRKLFKLGVDFIPVNDKLKPGQLETILSSKQAVVVTGSTLEAMRRLSYEALNLSDIVATKPSADVGMEAALISGKPVILFDDLGPHEKKIREMIREVGGIYNFRSWDSLGTVLKIDHIQGRLREKARKMRQNISIKGPVREMNRQYVLNEYKRIEKEMERWKSI